jgi:molybdopterin-containing oxidoreductase family membrane subunit
MWLKRYIIIVPTLYSPRIPVQGVPWEWAHYQPTWVEWSITAGAFATFILLYTLFSKMFPVISIWETNEQPGTHKA